MALMVSTRSLMYTATEAFPAWATEFTELEFL